MLKKPNEYQLKTVVTALQDKILRDWETASIASGVQRVCVNEVGYVTEVYLSPGLFGTLCHYRFGNRTRKPFWVNSIRVKQWRPNTQQLHRGNK